MGWELGQLQRDTVWSSHEAMQEASTRTTEESLRKVSLTLNLLFDVLHVPHYLSCDFTRSTKFLLEESTSQLSLVHVLV